MGIIKNDFEDEENNIKALQDFLDKTDFPARIAFRKFRDFQVRAKERYREVIRQIHNSHANFCIERQNGGRVPVDAFEKLREFHKNYVRKEQEDLEVFESLDVFKSSAVRQQVMKWRRHSDWRDWIVRHALVWLDFEGRIWENMEILSEFPEVNLEKFETRFLKLENILDFQRRQASADIREYFSAFFPLQSPKNREEVQKFLKIHENLEIESANAVREFQNNKCLKSLRDFQNQRFWKSRQAWAEFIEFFDRENTPKRVLIEIEEFQGREEFRHFQIMKIIAEFEID
jgi:hypothetical protein